MSRDPRCIDHELGAHSVRAVRGVQTPAAGRLLPAGRCRYCGLAFVQVEGLWLAAASFAAPLRGV